MPIPFEWDEEKAEINLKKHKVGFEEAKSVFGDPFSITVDDPDHSKEEQRFIRYWQICQRKTLGCRLYRAQKQNPNHQLQKRNATRTQEI